METKYSEGTAPGAWIEERIYKDEKTQLLFKCFNIPVAVYYERQKDNEDTTRVDVYACLPNTNHTIYLWEVCLLKKTHEKRREQIEDFFMEVECSIIKLTRGVRFRLRTHGRVLEDFYYNARGVADVED